MAFVGIVEGVCKDLGPITCKNNSGLLSSNWSFSTARLSASDGVSTIIMHRIFPRNQVIIHVSSHSGARSSVTRLRDDDVQCVEGDPRLEAGVRGPRRPTLLSTTITWNTTVAPGGGDWDTAAN